MSWETTHEKLAALKAKQAEYYAILADFATAEPKPDPFGTEQKLDDLMSEIASIQVHILF